MNWETRELLDHWSCVCPLDIEDYKSSTDDGDVYVEIDKLAEDLKELFETTIPKVEDNFWSSVISYIAFRIDFRAIAIYFSED